MIEIDEERWILLRTLTVVHLVRLEKHHLTRLQIHGFPTLTVGSMSKTSVQSISIVDLDTFHCCHEEFRQLAYSNIFDLKSIVKAISIQSIGNL